MSEEDILMMMFLEEEMAKGEGSSAPVEEQSDEDNFLNVSTDMGLEGDWEDWEVELLNILGLNVQRKGG